MILIPGSLAFTKLVMMSSSPAKSAGDARYVSQDPFIHSLNQHCHIQSRLQSVLGVSSFFIKCKRKMYAENPGFPGGILENCRELIPVMLSLLLTNASLAQSHCYMTVCSLGYSCTKQNRNTSFSQHVTKANRSITRNSKLQKAKTSQVLLKDWSDHFLL